jgi:hypothetical protein
MRLPCHVIHEVEVWSLVITTEALCVDIRMVQHQLDLDTRVHQLTCLQGTVSTHNSVIVSPFLPEIAWWWTYSCTCLSNVSTSDGAAIFPIP